jgi:hypothetical protein
MPSLEKVHLFVTTRAHVYTGEIKNPVRINKYFQEWSPSEFNAANGGSVTFDSKTKTVTKVGDARLRLFQHKAPSGAAQIGVVVLQAPLKTGSYNKVFSAMQEMVSDTLSFVWEYRLNHKNSVTTTIRNVVNRLSKMQGTSVDGVVAELLRVTKVLIIYTGHGHERTGHLMIPQEEKKEEKNRTGIVNGADQPPYLGSNICSLIHDDLKKLSKPWRKAIAVHLHWCNSLKTGAAQFAAFEMSQSLIATAGYKGTVSFFGGAATDFVLLHWAGDQRQSWPVAFRAAAGMPQNSATQGAKNKDEKHAGFIAYFNDGCVIVAPPPRSLAMLSLPVS